MTKGLPGRHAVRIAPTAEALLEEAAGVVAERIGGIERAPRVALAGGNTPRALHVRLAAPPFAARVAWRDVRFTFGDERCVPPDHPDSNHRMARETLLDPLRVPESHVLRLKGEKPAEAAAAEADRSLREWAQRTPLFDLVLLGMGEDGHTASLFPAEAWPPFGARLAAAVTHPSGAQRITLTPEALVSTAFTLFLVVGEGKAAAVRGALTAEGETPMHPPRVVAGRTAPALWMLDEAAAALLPAEWRE